MTRRQAAGSPADLARRAEKSEVGNSPGRDAGDAVGARPVAMVEQEVRNLTCGGAVMACPSQGAHA